MNDSEMTTERRTVELGDATTARVKVELGVGKLTLAGGASALLDAEFRYTNPAWRPEVAYTIHEGRGELTVRQPRDRRDLWDGEDERYEWDLRLNRDVPLELRVNLGVGASELHLGGLALTALDVALGVGDATIDLSGDWRRDLTVTINGGVGQTRVTLPHAVGARVEAKGGVGAVKVTGLREAGEGRARGGFPFRLPFPYNRVYLNDAYGQSDVTLRVEVNSGVGAIALAVAPADATNNRQDAKGDE